MKLTLSAPLAYRPAGLSFDSIIAKAASAAPGYDAALFYEICMEDTMTLKRKGGGEREGYSEEERERIGKGLPLQIREEETFMIPAGTYSFEQFPAIFTEGDLPRLILPYSGNHGSVYVRVFHENAFETALQLFFP